MPNSENVQASRTHLRQKKNPTGSIGYDSSALLNIPVVANKSRNSSYGTNGLIFCGVAVIVAIFYEIFLHAFQSAPKLEKSVSVGVPKYIMLTIALALVLALGAFASCVMGLREKSSKKTHAILGIVFSSLISLGVTWQIYSAYKVEKQRRDKLKAAEEQYYEGFRNLKPS